MPIRPTETLHDVGEFIRQQRENAQKSIRDLARSAIRQHRYSPVWTSISLVVSLFFLQAPLVGALEASWRSVFQRWI